jgi:hypothetical protein
VGEIEITIDSVKMLVQLSQAGDSVSPVGGRINMSTDIWFAAIFGAVFVLLLFGTAILMIVRPGHVPKEAMWILRVILALAGGGFGAVMSGMLKVDVNIPYFAIQATCGFAVFVLIYLANPPRRVENYQNVKGDNTKTVQFEGDNNKIDVS